MITSVEVRNFKCIKQQRIKLGRLTILTGPSGNGTSAFLQALLLVHHAKLSEQVGVLPPVRSTLTWSAAQDVLYSAAAGGSQIEVRIEDGNTSAQWAFHADSQGQTLLHLKTTVAKPDSSPTALASSDFSYIDHGQACTWNANLDLEPDQWIARTLGLNADVVVPSERRHPTFTEIGLLLQNTESWLSMLVDECNLRVTQGPKTDPYSLEVRFPKKGNHWSTLGGSGSGIRAALPVVLECLLAPRDGLVVLDSPEQDLDSHGQSQMGLFLAMIARSGVQVAVATHSDHLINGVRKGIAVESLISARHVALIFFAKAGVGMELKLNEQGGTTVWPTGLLDQFPADVKQIHRASTW